MKQIGLNEYVYYFLVDYGRIGVDNILDFPKYLMKRNSIK